MIDATEIVTIIADSAGAYLSEFSPIFLLIGGLVLAIGVIFALIGYFYPQTRPRADSYDDDDDW